MRMSSSQLHIIISPTISKVNMKFNLPFLDQLPKFSSGGEFTHPKYVHLQQDKKLGNNVELGVPFRPQVSRCYRAIFY